LHARPVSASEIRQLVDGEVVMNHPSLPKWFSDFKPGQVGTTDSEGSGRPTKTNIPENIARAEAAILDNRRVTVSELEHDLGL
jgi:hypothetical protein